jgi:hypothetical protein
LILEATLNAELLSLNRNQLRILTGLFTGHSHLKGHFFKLGLVDSPVCDRCKQASETASHVLGDCEALAAIRFRYLVTGNWIGHILRRNCLLKHVIEGKVEGRI